MLNRVWPLLLCIPLSPMLGFSQLHGATVLKVKIEAPQLDGTLLLKKLNDHGRDHGLIFEAVETGYSYRIVFGTMQGETDVFLWGSGGGVNSSSAGADVFDANGKELFRFKREGRGTDKGATNAVAKEIIKRLLRWRGAPEETR